MVEIASGTSRSSKYAKADDRFHGIVVFVGNLAAEKFMVFGAIAAYILGEKRGW